MSNLRIGEVYPETGQLLGSVFQKSLANVAANEHLEDIILAHLPNKANIGISAAGNVDEEKLVVLESANSKITTQINFGAVLRMRGYDVAMTIQRRIYPYALLL